MSALRLLGLLAAVLIAGCDCGRLCAPGSCDGCCDSSGACVSGLNAAQCGRGGAQCGACPSDQSCNQGVCGPTNGAGGGGGSAGGGGGSATVVPLHEYRITAESSVLAPACFKSPPSDLSLAARTFDVLVWDRPDGGGQLAVLTQMPDYLLGDSPPIHPPQAVKNAFDGAWDWQRLVKNPAAGADGGAASESRQISISLTINVAPDLSVTGTLQLQSEYVCIGSCPVQPAAPDAQSCSISLTVSGQEVAVDAGWTTPAQPIPGTSRYLLAADFVPQVADPSCYRTPPSTEQSEIHAVWLDVWQLSPAGTVTAGVTRFQLGDAPEIVVDGGLVSGDGGFDWASTSGAEVRLAVKTPLAANNAATLELRSQSASVSCSQSLPAALARVK